MNDGKRFRCHLNSANCTIFHVGLSWDGHIGEDELANASIVEAELPRVYTPGGVPHDEISIAVCKSPLSNHLLGGLAQSEVAISPVFPEARLVKELILFLAVGRFLRVLAQAAAKNKSEEGLKFYSQALSND